MKFTVCLAFLTCFTAAWAQQEEEEVKHKPLIEGLTYKAGFQGGVSHGKTPLWLNANRYGLSSLDETNGYVRASLIRPLAEDKENKWGLGYGVDVAVPYHYTSHVVVQQAFVEGRWLHGALTVGSKEYAMELKNNTLSSGSQTLGINARPVPQVRIALPDYWTLPFGNGWWHLKGHIAYGMMTDDRWQRDFTAQKSKYAERVLYHSKAGYLKIGNEEVFCPFSLEMGLEMATEFGGRAYRPDGKGGMEKLESGTSIKDFWNAFIPGGSDVTETLYQNIAGNQLGSWLIRMNWDEDMWRFGIYYDKYFEDQSAMFQLDYDGYGTGSEWQAKKKRRYFLYDFKDMLLGAELNIKYNRWINDVVFEYLYTKYQSGPVYHDHTPSYPDHIGGNDNFYNHGIYTGWQHWGQVMGNPLYQSPIYNTDGTIQVKDSRFWAFHLGVDGRPTDTFSYRVMASYQKGFGTYDNPFVKPEHNVSFLVEATYKFDIRKSKNWSLRGGYAMDFGKILGNNYGFQLTLSKSGLLKL